MVLTLTQLNGGCGQQSAPSKSDPPCKSAGQEKFTLHFDGVLSGVFEDIEGPNQDHPTTVIFKNGLLFNRSYVEGWINAQTQALKVPETHDALTFAIIDASTRKRLKTYTQTRVLDLDSQPAEDNCLLVKKLELKIKKTID